MVLVVEVVVVAVEAPPPPLTEDTVTVTDCGEPERDVCVLPAVSATLNEVARVSVEVTAPPPAVAVELAFNTQTVALVCTIEVMVEIPVRSKSTPGVVSIVAQSISSLPERMKEIDDVDDVVEETARVSVGAVESIVIVPVDAADKLLAESAAYTL
ncbi:MAG: hypothetical protein ACO33D_05160 [Ilumatobacteraceae bacterium]